MGVASALSQACEHSVWGWPLPGTPPRVHWSDSRSPEKGWGMPPGAPGRRAPHAGLADGDPRLGGCSVFARV